MMLSEKITQLRKVKGWSQKTLAEKLHGSRQAVSRWEGNTAQPDAMNLLGLSQQFGVSTDYLLNDEYENDELPKEKPGKSVSLTQMMIAAVTLEIIVLILQFIAAFILQNFAWSMLCFILFAAILGGFAWACHQRIDENNRTVCQRFFEISAWLDLYFPVRFIVMWLSVFYPRPYSSAALELVILTAYLFTVFLICRMIKQHSMKETG